MVQPYSRVKLVEELNRIESAGFEAVYSFAPNTDRHDEEKRREKKKRKEQKVIKK